MHKATATYPYSPPYSSSEESLDSVPSPRRSSVGRPTAAPSDDESMTAGVTSAFGGASQANSNSVDELEKVFHTAMVTTRAESSRDFTEELYHLIETPAFRTILNSVRQFARFYGLSDQEAASTIIRTFRKLDSLWTDYVFQEGADRLKNSKTS